MPLEPHDPLTCELCHADGTAAEIRAYREAIDLMLSRMTDVIEDELLDEERSMHKLNRRELAERIATEIRRLT